MTKSELINEIISEWAYRVNDGMPDTKNPKHINELGLVLSEMGMSDIKNELLENLNEEDKQFTNPILNKVIKYKNKKGEDKEGMVGNLLRLPKDNPGRVAAEKLLPADADEKDAAMKDLGSEKDGKSTKKPGDAEKPKDDKEADAKEPKEDPVKAAATMFDPNVDPAMGARLDREKAASEKLIAKDSEDKSAEVEVGKEETFQPIEAQDVQKEMPQADPDTFGGGSDIPDGVPAADLEQFNTDINKVAKQVADAKAKGEPAPNINLCDVTIPGTNLYCDDNLGIPRDEMPQFKGNAQPGSRAAGMEADKSGEVDTEPVFRKMLEEKGITVLQTEVPADKLKATQKDLVGAKVVGMMGALEEDPNHPKITAPIYVSRDGYVIDGHHRWAAVVAYNAQHPDNQIPMKTTVLDMDIKDAIPMANKFAEDMGIAAKKADANKEAPTSAPDGKINPIAKKAIEKIKDGVKNWSVEEKEFFNKKVHKGNSPQRRSFGEAFKHKMKGAWEAIKHGAEHEVHTFKEAGNGVHAWFAGEDVSDSQKKAMISVAKKVAFAAAVGIAGGGLAHGAIAFTKHLMVEFVPHIVAETVIIGAGKAALFAGPMDVDVDRDMMKFMEIIADKLQSEEIPNEVMADAIESYNQKKQPEMTNEQLELADELMLEIIYEFIDEAKPNAKAQRILNQRIKYKENGVEHDVKVSTAIKYKNSEKPGQKKAYKDALALLKKSGVIVNTDTAKKLVGKKIAPSGFRNNKKEEPTQPQTANTTKINSIGDAIFSTSKQPTDAKKQAFVEKKKDELNKLLFSMGDNNKLVLMDENGKSVAINTLKLSKVIDKVFSGSPLNDEDKKLFNSCLKLVTNPDNGDVKIYVSSKIIGRHPQQGYKSIEITKKNIPMGDSIRSYALQNGLNVGKSSEGAIGKKVLTPVKMASSVNPDKPETIIEIKKTANGVTIGGKEMKRLKELNYDGLVKSLTPKYGPEEAAKKAKLLVLQTKAYNQKLDDLAKIGEASGGKIPMANFGDVTTPESRKKTATNILDGIVKRFETELDSFGKQFGKPNLKNTPENKKVFDSLNKLKQLNAKANLETDENARAEYKATLDQLLLDMANSPDFRDSVADFAEQKAGLQFLAEGKQVYFPASENFQTADIIVMPDEFSVKPKKGQTTEEAIAENLQFYSVTVTYVGGLSVKYKGGGGSANYSKIEQTEYNNSETKSKLLEMQNVYSLAYPKDKNNQLNIKDADIKTANKKIEDTIQWAIKAKLITKEEAELIRRIGAGQAANTLKGGLKDVAKCKGANRKNFEQAIVLHHTMMHLTAVLNNRDMLYTRFSNFNEEVSQNKNGDATKITDDIADGVNKPCYMNPHHNPGFSTSPDEASGCVTGAPTNQNPSHIESEQPKNLLKAPK